MNCLYVIFFIFSIFYSQLWNLTVTKMLQLLGGSPAGASTLHPTGRLPSPRPSNLAYHFQKCTAAPASVPSMYKWNCENKLYDLHMNTFYAPSHILKSQSDITTIWQSSYKPIKRKWQRKSWHNYTHTGLTSCLCHTCDHNLTTVRTKLYEIWTESNNSDKAKNVKYY